MEPLIQTLHRFSRRSALRTFSALGISYLVPTLESKAANRRGPERVRSLIVVWLGGGPSQLETWDPHPNSKIGGPTQAITTSIPGVEIGEDYPQVAEQLANLSLIRSLVSEEGDHERGTYYLKTGYRPDPKVVHPSIGSVVAFERPPEGLEIPAHVSMGGGPWPPRGGYLGDEFDAFKIFDPGGNVRNMRAGVSEKRQDRRLANLDVVSQAFRKHRNVQVSSTLHQLTVERALRMMSSKQLKAFDIDEEPQELQDAYGDNRFGRGCLVARRLVEQGVRAIEVALNGWDTHASNFSGHQENAAMLDPGLASLVKDLKEKDLLESTLVLCIGEFGRTPRINPLDGRDHWPTGFSCLIGGGGLRSGLVIGATDGTGVAKDPSEPVPVQDLAATLFKAIGVEYGKELMTPIGRPLKLSQGKPLDRLFV